MAQPRTVDPTGQQTGRAVSVRVTPTQREQLERIAAQRGLTISELLRELLLQELDAA
jgi:DNA-binding MarR family transcriptional regulator